MADKDTDTLERVVEDGKPLLVCSCGVRFAESDTKFVAAHREHFDHLADGYVVPTVIAG